MHREISFHVITSCKKRRLQQSRLRRDQTKAGSPHARSGRRNPGAPRRRQRRRRQAEHKERQTQTGRKNGRSPGAGAETAETGRRRGRRKKASGTGTERAEQRDGAGRNGSGAQGTRAEAAPERLKPLCAAFGAQGRKDIQAFAVCGCLQTRKACFLTVLFDGRSPMANPGRMRGRKALTGAANTFSGLQAKNAARFGSGMMRRNVAAL